MRVRRILTILSAAALAAVPAVVLVGGASPAGAVPVGDEASFRTAWDTATDITLTANITLTCANGGDADRSSNDPVVLDGAGHTIALEVGCNDRVLDQNGDGNTTLRNVTVTGGNTTSDGGGYEHDGTGSLTIESSTFANNTACSEGGGAEVENEADGPQVTIRNSTFVGNRSSDEAGVNMDDGGALLVVNSTFTGNVANSDGAISGEADEGSSATITLVYATVVGNIETTDACPVAESLEAEAVEPEDAAGDEVEPLEAGEPANVSVDDNTTLRSFGSVVARPQGTGAPTPNCEIDLNPTISSGYNFSDDATCGFTNTATGDRENAGDPLVGALASNGGPTQTMLPQTGSPLLNFIPIASCGGGDALAGFAVTTDQRGVSRPQATGCEIGSVEIEAIAIVVTPTFTG